MGDPMVWDTSAAELDSKGFVNQYGLSRKVNILTLSGMDSVNSDLLSRSIFLIR